MSLDARRQAHEENQIGQTLAVNIENDPKLVNLVNQKINK